PALPPDVREGTGVAGKEVVGRLPGRRRDVAEGVYADLQPIGRVPRTRTRLPIEIDERTEAARFPADDGDHQRKTKRAGTGERARRTADTQPYGQRILHWSRVYALACQGSSMFARLGNVLVITDLEAQIELLGKE